MKRIFTIALFTALTAQASNAQLIINELMQSNIDCIMDDLNEFPDSWVELYNCGEEPVNLQYYKIGLTDDATSAFQLPNYTVAKHGYVVIFCDKSDIPVPDLHTDFRLESGKDGNVYLFQNDVIIDKLENMAKQPAPNIAYGRLVINGVEEWGYLDTATPNAVNSGTICKDDEGNPKILGEPVFSEKGRVMTTSGTISLTLSLPEGSPEGTVIRYTTNGSEPTLENGSQYNLSDDPISITSNMVIRAKLFCDGYLSPISTAQSYIFLGREMPFSVISIVTDDRYLNADDIGIIKNNPNKDNKHDWRRPINFEFFDAANKKSAINQLGETRVAGGQSREHPLKTLVVYANKRFGQKRLKYEFFSDQKPGLKEFKSLMLRNSGNDFAGLYMRDAVIQRVMGQHADLDWQAWRPAIIYINGTYKGMLNIRERSNDDNIYTNYAGQEDIDMVEISHKKEGNNDLIIEELKAGTWNRYNEFKAFYHESGHTLAEYEQLMDWKEYINLMAMNLYYGNLDFPGNNLVVWVPTEDGGKWRFIAKDTDFGLGLYGRSANHNTIEWIYNKYDKHDTSENWANSHEATLLFRNLMETDAFKREFIDRCAIYMGDFLNARGTNQIWDPMNDLVHSELILHRQINPNTDWWGNPVNDQEQAINDEITSVNTWLSQRTNNFYTHLKNYYGLGTPTTLIINKNNITEPVTTIVNGIELQYKESNDCSPYFDGKFFAGRQLTVRGKASEGRKVSGWTVKQTNSNNRVTTTEVSGSTYTFDMPSCKSLELTAKFADYLRGDVNKDGKVDITDVTELVNIVLGRNNDYDIVDADLNDDGEPTITDVTILTNIILGRDADTNGTTTE